MNCNTTHYRANSSSVPGDPTERPYYSVVADVVYGGLVDRFSLNDTEEARFAFETTLVVSDALAARAFARDAQGDSEFLTASRELTRSMLAPHFS